MKMNKKLLLSAAVLLGAAASLDAQVFQEGFLLNDYRLSYRYNPALMTDTDFISTGELTTNRRSNVGASNFLYPYDGGVVTFLHSSVPTKTFQEGLEKNIYFLRTLDYNMISYGTRRGEALHTFEANFRGVIGASAPSDILMMLKAGTTQSSYQLDKLRGEGDLYLELAYGYSRQISDIFSLGARVKLLVGLYSVDYNVTKFDLDISEERYHADINTELHMTDSALQFDNTDDGFVDYSTMLYKGLGNRPSGGGLAVDLGLAFKPTDNLTISASILDLGSILWYYGNGAYSTGAFDFTGFNNLQMENMNVDGIMQQLSDVKDEFISQIRPRSASKKALFKAIPFTANAGVKYAMPFYDKLTVGLIGSYTGYQWMPYWEGRFAMGIQPVDWLDLMADFGTGSYGLVFAAGGSVRVNRFRFNLGIQNGFGGTVPKSNSALKANSKSLTFGITYDLP